MFISNGSAWTYVPSGDEPEGTVINIAVQEPLTTDITSLSFPGGGAPISAAGTISLKSSGVTASSYGPSADSSPGVSGTFSVPYITVDTYGRITAASTKTITLPVDSKVYVKNRGATKAYVLGTTTAPTSSD